MLFDLTQYSDISFLILRFVVAAIFIILCQSLKT